ncbi:MAG: hopanoid C-3 methylase HpnR [Verrucomicrobia bacterium]|nr:hopanoid C-3 methylase HpnR [Verrucomicrobiota bacterium]
MRLLAVHPSSLMYSRIYLRLEPLGLELVAAAAQKAGHDVRLVDLQAESHRDYLRLINEWKPEAVAFSCNYLANVPEILDLAKATRERSPGCAIFIGGHSASFIADELLAHADGAVDAVLKGEGEPIIVQTLNALQHDPQSLHLVPGVQNLKGQGAHPLFVSSLDDLVPARDLLRHRRRYFIGTLDPCASIEFSRGCPWDCVICSAWTFYGRSYRTKSPESAVEEISRIREPGIFLLDDVAFIQAEHGMRIGELIAKRGIRKKYYLETRGDILLRNKEVFQFWRKLGLEYMFLGLEAIDEDGLKRFRKRITLSKNFEALDFARSLGMAVAINIIADPSWDAERFRVVRQWCMEVPEIVNISVNTPYPGTESWRTEARKLSTRDYRLFDIQHAVLPTKLSLPEFYRELVETQRVLSIKHLGVAALKETALLAADRLMHGQTNFVKMLWKFNSVYDPKLQVADHQQPVKYSISLPPPAVQRLDRNSYYIHSAKGRQGRQIDNETEAFVDSTRMGAS